MAPASPLADTAPLNPADAPWMQEALALARAVQPISPPNPAVGCIVVPQAGQPVVQGATQAVGGRHAEAQALHLARERGIDPRGATVYVSLEPCSHHGRTPPCADALVASGVSRVVIAVQDPNPLVAGRGIERLRAAGVQVDVGLLADPARELNIGFFSRMLRGRPWVRLKVAASLDGRTALPDGRSQWITGPAAREDGHRWRARAGAILTGVGTVLEDNPRLNVRLPVVADDPATPGGRWRQPPRVIIDSRLETPPTARLLQPGPGEEPAAGPVWIYAAQDDPQRRAALQAAGAHITVLPGPNGKVDLAAVLQDLARREVNELHLEAGHKLNGSFVREGLVDEYLVYLAPKLLGEGREMARFGPLRALDQGPALRFHDITPVGPDLRIVARPEGRDAF